MKVLLLHLLRAVVPVIVFCAKYKPGFAENRDFPGKQKPTKEYPTIFYRERISQVTSFHREMLVKKRNGEERNFLREKPLPSRGQTFRGLRKSIKPFPRPPGFLQFQSIQSSSRLLALERSIGSNNIACQRLIKDIISLLSRYIRTSRIAISLSMILKRLPLFSC